MDYDIAIIGAGPAGLSFALSLRDSGLKVAVVEKQTSESLQNPAYDGREIALTHLSKRLMHQHGSWQRLGQDNIHPLKAASVINGTSDYRLHFDAPEHRQEPLGYLVSNQHIRRAIFAEFNASQNDSRAAELLAGQSVSRVHTDSNGGYLTLDDGKTISASMVVAADTRFSTSRNQMGIASDYNDYGRSALLCVMNHEKPHQHTALECFLYGGTLAVLPLNEYQCSVVITVNSAEVSELLAMPEDAFNREVEHRLGSRLGKMTQSGERYHYPLVGVHARRYQANRFALVGDSAVGMHPVTAHGFNLGLSGQDLLSTEMIKAIQQGRPFWDSRVLKAYEHRHMPNARVLYHGTNTVVGLFTDDRLPARVLRNAVLRISNHLPPLKQAIRQKLMNRQHPALRLF
ncbi:MAG: ubiquinone biosynthesis protein UbiH [Oceanospirillaceae bacterium]|nr:ubiquinone biosynthesis protein UbiH [Oceanospirillaceae bacterium]|tara:strand:- start:48063 stop:49268 length:1206 start_codon:yes stop_codon:yes gene_type:complete